MFKNKVTLTSLIKQNYVISVPEASMLEEWKPSNETVE